MFRLLISVFLSSLCVQLNAAPQSPERLYEAIIHNRPEIIDEFLNAGGDPNALAVKGEWSGSLLEIAVRSRRDEIATALLAAGADAAAAEKALSSSLTALAIEQGMDGFLARLLDTNPRALVDDDAASSPLVIAATNGRYDAVIDMLKRAERQDLSWGNRLAVAFQSGANYEDIARLLLQAGLDPRTPGLLHAAVNASGPGLVHYLIEAGASPTSEVRGQTPIDVALARLARTCSGDGGLVLAELVDAGADPCYLVEDASRFSSSTLLWLNFAAPQCDWSAVHASERAGAQQNQPNF